MGQLHFPFTLRLYAHVLQSLRDHNFTGLDLFYRVKDCWKARDTPHDLLVKPLEKGLSYKIGEWCFDTMLDPVGGKSESMPKPYIATRDNEDVVWFLEDLINAAKLSGFFNPATLDPITSRITEIDLLYESDEKAYWTQIGGAGRRQLSKLFAAFCASQPVPLTAMRALYAPEIADRILHDRQLCSFIAETIMNIGFDGEAAEGIRSRWVERETWPTRVKAILNSRDRGKCAACGTDIVMELDEDGHVDHIFPISQGAATTL
jgi:hypothetical protein